LKQGQNICYIILPDLHLKLWHNDYCTFLKTSFCREIMSISSLLLFDALQNQAFHSRLSVMNVEPCRRQCAIMATSRSYILITVCFLWGCMPVLCKASSDSVLLMNRIRVLEQAQQQAQAELQAREEQRLATEADRLHQQKVDAFLQTQLNEVCKKLILAGDNVADLPCEQTPAKNITSPAKTSKPHPQINKQRSPVPLAHQPEEPAPVQKISTKKPPKPVQPPQKTKSEEKKPKSILETLTQWLKSLFMPKPPSSPSQSTPAETHSSSKEKEDKQQQPEQQPASAIKDTREDVPDKNNSTTNAGTKKKADKKENRKKAKSASSADKQIQSGKTARERQQQQTPMAFPESRLQQASQQTRSKTKQSSGQKQQPLSQKKSGSKQRSTAEPQAKKNHPLQKGIQRHKPLKEKITPGNQQSQPKTAQGKKQQANSGGARKKVKTQPSSQAETTGRTAIKTLEHSLNTSLGRFDSTLQQAQDRLSTRIPSKRAGSTAGAGGVAASVVHAPATKETAGTYEQSGGVNAAGTSIKGGTGQTSIDADDDIVARQLREAAEKEKDPALKKKLWQEYKKYKAGK
jgi:hypothetical protein